MTTVLIVVAFAVVMLLFVSAALALGSLFSTVLENLFSPRCDCEHCPHARECDRCLAQDLDEL